MPCFNKRQTIPVLAAILTLWVSAVAGAEGDIKSIPVGPFELSPLLDVSESYSDNIYWNNLNRKGSMITQFQPGLQLALERQLNRYALNYVFNSIQFHSSPHDNFIDQYVGGQAHMEFGSRHRLDADARFVYAHNQRGTNFSQGIISLIPYPDEFIQNTLATKYRYGAEGAPGNLEVLFNLRDLTYQNHRNRTAQWDRTEFIVTPGFYYRAFPKTLLSAQAEVTVQDYKNDLTSVPTGLSSSVTNLSYNKERYLLGFTWDPTAKTNIRTRLGYLQQNFTDRNLPQVNDFTWDVGAHWYPKSYSRVSLESTRDTLPTFGTGYIRLIENVQLSWTHDWTEQISTRIYGTYQHVDNKGSIRLDDYYGARLDAGYKMKPWLGFGLSYTYLVGNSNPTTYSQLNYDQNVVMFYISGNPFSAQNSGSPWHLWYGN
jgi:hypothetical protein